MSTIFIDFGSQYAHLLRKSLFQLGYETELMNFAEYNQYKGEVTGVVLSGGPKSVYEDINYKETKLYKDMINGIPMIGVCYGFQILASLHDCKIVKGETGEYGRTTLEYNNKQVWMSHRDTVIENNNIHVVNRTKNGYIATFESVTNNTYCFQFHPEVKHTEDGQFLLKKALHHAKFPEPTGAIRLIAKPVPNNADKLLCAFSGGVDSLVAAVHAHNQVGDRLHCLYIDTGMMRYQDRSHIENIKSKLGLNIEILDASGIFLDRLIANGGVTDPEKKRKIIGNIFIEVFDNWIKENGGNYTHLMQGTIFPDIIESNGSTGQAEVIKSHHNVGGLPENMNLKLYEPLRDFYKDDVREYGLELGIPQEMIYRHPFPGPGLGIRVVGQLSEKSLKIAKDSDQILYEELVNNNFYDKTWQAYTAVLPINTVGVKGDSRTYEKAVVIRMVNSSDGMTATFSRPPYDLLDLISTRILNEVSGVNRVFYDVSNKPPATIEME